MQNSHAKNEKHEEPSPWSTLLKFAGIGMALGVAAIAGYSVIIFIDIKLLNYANYVLLKKRCTKY